jgi:transposase InsO family protein
MSEPFLNGILHDDYLGEPLSSATGVTERIRYTERLAEAGVERSVGSVDDSYDNALAESINGLFKAEVVRRLGPWRSIDNVEHATLVWVHWFNTKRLLGPIGYVPPLEFEERDYREHGAQAAVA